MKQIAQGGGTLHRRTRGFALLIVLALATAALVTAVGLSSTSRRAGAVAVIEEGGSIADSLARSGLARAVAYALQVSAANNGDFDKVLDPQLEADCATSLGGGNPFNFGQVDGTNDILRPMFTDAAGDVEWPTGSDVWWRVVADGGGAYLVRFEDDEDDIATDAAFNILTANNPGSGACLEGPNDPATYPEGYDGATNPVRDRNRSIWVIAVGLYRGTDPNTAHYRSTRRQLLVDTSAAAGVSDAAFHAFQIRADGGSSTVWLHSDEAPARAQQFHAHGTEFSGCQLQATVFHDASDFSDPGAGVCGTNAHALNSGPAPVAPLDVLNARYMDFSSPCNFVMRNLVGGADPEGLWYWDHLGVRPFGNCNDPALFAAGIPLPDTGTSPQNVNNRGSCWIPLMASPTNDDRLYTPCQLGEVFDADPGGTEILEGESAGNYDPMGGANGGGYTGPIDAWWRPSNTSPAPTTIDCNGYFSAPVEVHKPAWDTMCGTGPSFPPASPAPSVWDCTACDGSTWAVKFSMVAPYNDLFTFNQVNGGTQPIPRGLYIVPSDWITTETNVAAAPADQITGYPPITMIVTGRLMMDSNAILAFGTAGHPNLGPPINDTPDAQMAYPSLILGDELGLNSNAQIHAAGGVYYDDGNNTAINTDSASLIRVHGPWVSDPNVIVRIDGSSRFEWTYMNPLFTTTTGAVVSGSTVRLTFPLRL